MRTDEFVERVHLREPVANEETAHRATRVTLHALGQILSAEEARKLAAQLPAELADAVNTTAEQPGPADAAELYERVADRVGVDRELAVGYANAVFGVLRKAVSEGEFIDVVMELPSEFDELIVI